MTRCLLFLLLATLLTSCQQSVTRVEVIQMANAYCLHKWTPTEANIFHGEDEQGIRVDTPDRGFRRAGTRPGWWVLGEVNEGVPYQWGGFDTPAAFDKKVAQGFAAGDIYTPAKRKGLEEAVSRQACGVDCSGFISRCWRLPRAYSTRELPTLCEELASYEDLLAGDILNRHNDHVLLFGAFKDAAKKVAVVYETGAPPTWKTVVHHLPVSRLKAKGYRPYRYRGIRD
ncbi:hypothetical protein AAFN60_06670 [Roseibacillus persicicus]|uniref:hypothetical protein n=1 Tax=Roseibacillus persicicus TaxID=454148 RepID=UPI00398A6A62